MCQVSLLNQMCNIKFRICTTRFNNKTMMENQMWRLRNNMIGNCVYGLPSLSPLKELDGVLLVLEMNNDTNRIEGIGVLENRKIHECSVYDTGNYNRYVFVGKYRFRIRHTSNKEAYASSDDEAYASIKLTEEEIIVIKMLEIALFYGYKHSKRGRGISTLPKHVYELYDFTTTIKYLCKRVLLTL